MSADPENGAPDDRDPLAALVDRRREELEELAASDNRAAWVAEALLTDAEQRDLE